MSRLPSITAVSTPRTAGRARVEPVGHPGRVDPRPPDDEQQEGGARHAGDGEVVDDLVRQLRDREDVDQVEEQLDRGGRLRDAVAARSQVADRCGGRAGHRPGRLAGVGDDPVRREIDERSAGATEAMRQQRRVPPWWPRKWWTSRYGVEMTAARSPRTSADHEERDDDDDDEDRQRRAHQEPEEHDGRHLDGAERAGGGLARQQGVLLERLGGGCGWGGS